MATKGKAGKKLKKNSTKKPKKKALKTAAKKPVATNTPISSQLKDDDPDAKPIPEDEELLYERP